MIYKRVLVVSSLLIGAYWIYLEFFVAVKTDRVNNVKNSVKLVSQASLENTNKEMVSPEIQVNLQKIERLEENHNNCLSSQEIHKEYEKTRLYKESLGNYYRSANSNQMPEYWYYSTFNLLDMVKIGDASAKYFAGVKLMYEAVGMKIDDYFNLPYFINEEILISQYDDKKMDRARQLLYDAAVNGKIHGMFRLLVSYDLEKYFLISKKRWSKESERKYQEKRNVTYFVYIEPFDTKFGTLDLRPFHRKDLPEKTEIAIKQGISQFNEKRNSIGLSPLMLASHLEYLDDWADRERCN